MTLRGPKRDQCDTRKSLTGDQEVRGSRYWARRRTGEKEVLEEGEGRKEGRGFSREPSR